ncbi:hypothetical protein HK16_04500 [Acetobacter senegalensis]|uniref:Uncharacterized protein n=2 Tax=Acetobacter TaxID=434 RepID=A0A252EDI0_9PROT|nr:MULTISPECIES: hypothetical protein [Acetobacter]ATJ90681.1 hypothetical protein CIW82_08270 [Acetobacter tropicalis]OUL64541.1 hypothetical protein HK16_04500 [Acetobacter senegalensis]
MCGISRFKTCDDDTVRIEIELPLSLPDPDAGLQKTGKARILANIPRDMVNTSRPLLLMEKKILEAVRSAAAARLSDIIGAIHAASRS